MLSTAALAKKHNGFATWTFSQGALNVWRHMATDPDTRFGICAALAAQWIKHHADGGSLVKELGGGGVGELNVKKLKEIVGHHAWVSSKGGEYQKAQLKLWLQMNDIVEVKRSIRPYTDTRVDKEGNKARILKGNSVSYELTDAGVGKVPNIEGEIVQGLKRLNTCYARLSISGTFMTRSVGHALAVWVGQRSYSGEGDALFFDPNHGEYWFERKSDFFRFFLDFYKAKYLTLCQSYNTGWELLPCAKSNAHRDRTQA